MKGCAAGLAVGLVLVPVAVLGVPRTLACYSQLGNAVLRPGLTHEGDTTRAKELTNMTGTGSQSFIAVSHNTLHLDRATRPEHADPLLRLAALAGAGVVTLLTLLVAYRTSIGFLPSRICCRISGTHFGHSESVSRSYMTMSLWRSMPDTPNSCEMPSTRRSCG